MTDNFEGLEIIELHPEEVNIPFAFVIVDDYLPTGKTTSDITAVSAKMLTANEVDISSIAIVSTSISNGVITTLLNYPGEGIFKLRFLLTLNGAVVVKESPIFRRVYGKI